MEKRKNNQPIFRLTRKHKTNKNRPSLHCSEKGGGWRCGDERGVIVPFATPPLYFVPRKKKLPVLRRGQCGDEMGTSYHSQPPPLYWFTLRKQKQTNKQIRPLLLCSEKGDRVAMKGVRPYPSQHPPPLYRLIPRHRTKHQQPVINMIQHIESPKTQRWLIIINQNNFFAISCIYRPIMYIVSPFKLNTHYDTIRRLFAQRCSYVLCYYFNKTMFNVRSFLYCVRNHETK